MNKKIIIATAGVAAVILCFFLFWNFDTSYENQHFEVDNSRQQDSVVNFIATPTLLYGFEIDSMIVIQGRIKRNQNLSEILINYNISNRKIHELVINSKPVFDVRKIVSNRKYTMICYPDSLKTAKAMIYEPSATEYIVFDLDDSVTVKKMEKEVVLLEKRLAGVIERSLAVSIKELGESPQLTNDLVDVLAWQIDFFRLQKGDKFKVIFEERQVDGEAIGVGNIKGVYMEHFGNDYYAYYFDQGSGIDYFDDEGHSLRKALLKYPLDFTRISSRYSGNRFHPVQKRWKAHRGTDFAAPKGTPIRSVGDGIVINAEYGVNNGNFVKIKHNSTYTTQYLHMSKIASGIKRGVKVKQDQTIGYVGSTGLARGNHLCYRFWKNGVQIDALKVKLPPSEPIHEKNKVSFEAVSKELKSELDSIEYPSPIASL
jgi:murein DD-endopeptidase MepM/ murein hydrolase activator NlpD